MKKNILIVCLFILFALPIPIAIAGFGMCLIWLMASLIKGVTFVEIITSLFGVMVGLTYLITYIFALTKTWKERKITLKTFFPIAHCLLAFLFLLSLKPTANYISETTEYFGFAKKDFSVVDELDTHGGFHGDGSYYLILDCSNGKEKALKKVENWNKLPLPENLNLIMYGGEKDGVEYGYFSEQANWPEIRNGVYKFVDRNSDAEDPSDDKEILSRGTANFSIAVYDLDSDMLYYFEADT